MWNIEEEAKRLAARFDGINRAAFAREHKVPGGATMVYQHIQGLKPISMNAAKAYAKGFNCPLEEISQRLAAEARASSKFLTSSGGIEQTETSDAADSRFVRFELHPVRYSAGPGASANTYDVVEHLDIARQWAVEKLGSCDPERIKIVTCSGTSMSPTIPDGSLLFVDVRINHFVGDGIYCLSVGHGASERLLVKRVRQRLKPPCIEVISDNPTGPEPETYLPHEESQLTISAKVVGWWSMGVER